MDTSERVVALVGIALALLLISSPLIVFSSSSVPAVVAQAGSASEGVDPVTGESYGDLSQYDWSTGGYDQSNTRFSPGPAPDKPDVLWKYAASGVSGAVTVFDGKAFVASLPPFFGPPAPSIIYAFDAFTGELKWQTPLPVPVTRTGSTTGITKIDDNHLMVDINGGLACLNIETGVIVWNFTGYIIGQTPGSGFYFCGIYSSESKMKYVVAFNQTTRYAEILAFDLSDPSKLPPIAWRYTMDEGGEILCFGGGKLFVGSCRYSVYALNGTTGELIWRSPKIGLAEYLGTYYNGNLYHGSTSTRLTCYDGNNGTILWDYDAGGRAFFAYDGCAAYGRYYQHNIDPINGFVGCWDTETGELLWRQIAYYFIGYLCPVVADGKIYVTTSDGGTVLGQRLPPTSFTCFDAFSGTVLWTIPDMNLGLPSIAYGNLYGVYGGTVYCIGSLKPATPWSMWRGSLDNPGVVAGSAPNDISHYKWKYKTEGAVTSSPAIVDGRVYIGSHDQNIYCLDAYNGSLIWKFPINYSVMSSPAVVGGRVYTGADDGNIYCIDADTGTQIWKKYAGGWKPIIFTPIWQPRSSPIVVGDSLFVGALDGKVYCVNTANGDIEWTYQTGDPIGGSPAYSNGFVYIMSTDRYIYALHANNGTLKWKTETPSIVMTGPATLNLISSPTVAEGKVFVGAGWITTGFAPGPILLALDANNGTIVWQAIMLGSEYPVFTPTYAYGVVYVPEKMYLSAYNATDGSLMWRQWLGHESFSSVAYADDLRGPKIYIGDDVYSITCINATSGVPMSVYTTKGQVQSSPAIWEGKLYVGSADMNVYCFDDAPAIDAAISACLSADTIDEGDSVTVTGQLFSPQTNEYTGEQFTPGLPNMPVLVSFGKDGDRHDESATTDKKGEFTVTYTPTEAGTYSVMAWYEGKDMVTYSYNYAYSDEMSLKVKSEEEPPNGNGEEPEEGIPMEYVYAIVAAIAIVIIAAVGYLYMKRRK
jgi:outer membrane protein assembly factor BamB